MKRLFVPLVVVTAAMFAYAPFVIANAPYESTMGLVQKIFYFHVPSWMAMFTAIAVCGVASAMYLFKGNRRPIGCGRGGGARGAVRADRPGHRTALGAEGVGRLVAVGRAPDDGAAARADVRRATCSCGSTAGPDPRSWRPRRRSSAWPTSPFVYMSVNIWRDDASEDDRGADAATGSMPGRAAVLVQRAGVRAAVRRC